MDRRAFLGAAAAGLAVGPTALAVGQVAAPLDVFKLAESGPTTLEEFGAWLGRQFTVVKWVDEVTAMDIKHHATVVVQKHGWTREDVEDGRGAECMRAAECRSVQDAVRLIQGAINDNPKALGAYLILRRAWHLTADAEFESGRVVMKLRLRFSCSEPLPGITCPVPTPIFSRVDRNAWWVQTPAPVRS